MKKNSLKIVAALLISSSLFFGCKKAEEATTGAANCATVGASFTTDALAYTTAVQKYEAAQTTANCNAVKTSLTKLIKNLKGCSQYAAYVTEYEAAIKDFTCGN